MVDDHQVRKLARLWSKVNDHFWRGVYLLGVLSFLLPFVSAKGCGSDEFVDYRGFQLIKEQDGWLFLFPICMGLACFGLSFIRRRRGQILQGFMKSGKAVLSSTAGSIVVIWPSIQFIFGTVHARFGWILSATCWSLVYVVSFVDALKRLLKMRRSRRLSSLDKGKRFALLRVSYYIVGLLVLIAPFVCFHQMRLADPLGNLLLSILVLLLFSAPIFLALHFSAEGLKDGERWAPICGASITFLFLAGGVISSTFLIKEDTLWWVIADVSASCFAAIVLLHSLLVIRRSCIEYRQHLIKGH